MLLSLSCREADVIVGALVRRLATTADRAEVAALISRLAPFTSPPELAPGDRVWEVGDAAHVGRVASVGAATARIEWPGGGQSTVVLTSLVRVLDEQPRPGAEKLPL